MSSSRILVSLLLLLVMVVSLSTTVSCQFCNRPDGVTCEDPPYTLATVHNFGPSVLSVLGHRSDADRASRKVVVGGFSSSGGRALYSSEDGGNTWTQQAEPNGPIYALSFGASDEELLLGSMIQDVPVIPSPSNTSFAQFRDERTGEDAWVAASLEDLPENTRAVHIAQKGVSFHNGTFYAGVTMQFPVTQDPYLEYFAGISTDNGRTFSFYPWSSKEYPIFQIRMIDAQNGIAIGGQHWVGNYENSVPTEEEYVAITAVTHDGGQTWEQTFFDEGHFTFVDIDCIDRTCWVVAMGLGYSIPDNIAIIYQSTDGGYTWNEQFRTINENEWDGGLQFVSIHMIDARFGYAAGNFRSWTTVLVTYDGGEHWNYAYEPHKEWRQLVYDVYDVDGVLYLLTFHLSSFQTSLIRVDPPQ